MVKVYWGATGLFCLAMATSGTLNLLRVEFVKEGLTGLGYPVYLMTILGVAKLLGVVALLVPRMKRLKEWAYAGFTFELLGATASHAFIRDEIGETVTPVVVLAFLLVSYMTRPSDRRL